MRKIAKTTKATRNTVPLPQRGHRRQPGEKIHLSESDHLRVLKRFGLTESAISRNVERLGPWAADSSPILCVLQNAFGKKLAGRTVVEFSVNKSTFLPCIASKSTKVHDFPLWQNAPRSQSPWKHRMREIKKVKSTSADAIVVNMDPCSLDGTGPAIGASSNFVRGVSRILKPGGLFIFQSPTGSRLSRNYLETEGLKILLPDEELTGIGRAFRTSLLVAQKPIK